MQRLAITILGLIALAAPLAGDDSLADLADSVSKYEVEHDEWPFEELPSGLREPLYTAVAEDDPDRAVASLAQSLGDEELASTILRTALELLADFYPEESPLAARREAELLEVLRARPDSEEVRGTLWLFYTLREHFLPETGESLLSALADLDDGPEIAFEIAKKLEKDHGFRRILLAFAYEQGVAAVEVLTELAATLESEHGRAVTLKSALERVNADDRERLIDFEQKLLLAYLSAGRPTAAIRLFESSDPLVRQAPKIDGPGEDPVERDVRLEMAAAYLLAGEPGKARGQLDRVPPPDRVPPTGPEPVDSHERRAVRLRKADAWIWQALDQLHTPRDDDPFDPLAELALEANEMGDYELIDRKVLLEALAGLSQRAGYSTLAAYFIDLVGSQLEVRRASIETPEASWNDFGAGFAKLRQRSLDELAITEARYEKLGGVPEPARRDPMSATIGRLLAGPRLVPFRELPLPEGIEPGSHDGRDLPAGLPLPKGLRPVRAEQRADLAVVVGLSQALDAVGEVSAGGYWIAHSADGGASWTRLYTGLRQMQPYAVVPRSQLGLLAGDHLHLEVRIRELDESVIMFPPVYLKLKSEAEGLYLAFPWSELRRDRDGDGLTDLVEERLVTDPERADTDGDGVDDAEDPLPAVPFSGALAARSAALAALLTEITGEEAAAIIPECPDGSRGFCFQRPELGEKPTHFVLGERRHWAALAPLHRTVVLSAAEVELLKARFGIFFPTQFPLFALNRTGDRAVAIWTRSWVGGSAMLERRDSGWVVLIRSSWIT